MDEKRYERQISLGRMVARGCEEFWMKKQLGVDRRGRVYRTGIPRERPILDYVDFRNPKRKD
jgi:hypothetical protein